MVILHWFGRPGRMTPITLVIAPRSKKRPRHALPRKCQGNRHTLGIWDRVDPKDLQ